MQICVSRSTLYKGLLLRRPVLVATLEYEADHVHTFNFAYLILSRILQWSTRGSDFKIAVPFDRNGWGGL